MPVITNHHQHGEDDDGPTAPPTQWIRAVEKKRVFVPLLMMIMKGKKFHQTFPLNSWKRPFLGQAATVCCKTGQATCFVELQCMLHVDVLKDVVVYE